MTARPVLDDRDPLPPEEHRPVSSEWARRAALEACEQAVRAAKDARIASKRRARDEKPAGNGEGS